LMGLFGNFSSARLNPVRKKRLHKRKTVRIN